MIHRGVVWAILFAVAGYSQTLDQRSLSGRYWVRHLQLGVDSSSTISSARTFTGTFSFDGNGAYTFNGSQVIGSYAPSALNGSGTYSVQSAGSVSLTNPQQTGTMMNGRLGIGALVASTTEGNSGTYDLLIAVPLNTAQAAPGLSGTYWISSLDFQNGLNSGIRNSFFKATSTGQGSFGTVTIAGQAVNAAGQALSQTSALTYSVTADGSGTLNFPAATSGNTAPLISGSKNLYVSPDGNFFFAGSPNFGGQDMIVGVKALPSGANAASLSGLYYIGGLRYEQTFNAYVGSANSGGSGKMVTSRRTRIPGSTVDLTAVNGYTIGADSSGGGPDINSLAVGAGGNAFLLSGAEATATGVYELGFGIRAPSFSGSGVYINPAGIVNGASFAPVGNPISPGELITIFGSGLANSTDVAANLPFPTSLGGVQVSVNGTNAPVYAVSPAQLSALVPFATQPGTATISVTNNGTRSNSVSVPVSRTSPGIFTVPPAGIGPGAILHADYSLVGAAKPAQRGETVLIFLTGLGTSTPPVKDGDAAPVSPLSTVDTPVNVYIGGLAANVTFKGPAPLLAGLYQLNVSIPADAPVGNSVALAVETPDAFHDQVDIAIK